MTQHLAAPPRPWVGLESHLPSAPRTGALGGETPPSRQLTAIALVLGYLARKRGSSATA